MIQDIKNNCFDIATFFLFMDIHVSYILSRTVYCKCDEIMFLGNG